MNKSVPLDVKQAAMRARQYCKTCGKHLSKSYGGERCCKCPRRGEKAAVAELLRRIKRSMKEWESTEVD